MMDPAFVPSEIAVRHFVSHKFTFELGPSVINLGKPIRNLLIALVTIKVAGELAQSVLYLFSQRRGTR